MQKRVELMMAMTIVLLLVGFSLYLGAGISFCATEAEIQEYVEAHNIHRGLHGVPPVTWSSTLAASAQAWANTCPTGHSGPGENMSYAGYIEKPKDVVDDWYSEESLYDYNNPGFSMDTGHFTQVVWKSTTQIGCGYRLGCSGTSYPNITVCQYSPAGNGYGQFPANVLPPNPPDYAWTSMTSGTTVILHEVWGSSASNVFAVGAWGTVLRYNGSSWLRYHFDLGCISGI